MNKDDLYTARWHLSAGKPVPGGGPLEALYELLAKEIGPLPGVLPPINPVDPAPVEPTDPGQIPPAKRAKVAIIVGHNSRQPGAWVLDPVNKSEFAYHSEVAKAIESATKGTEVDVETFFREYSSSGYAREIDNVYAEVNRYNPDLAVELHFNGGGGNYSMMIVAKGSALGAAAGKAMLNRMASAIGIPVWQHGTPRGISPLSRGDRGGRSVWAASCPTVLTEPFFGDHSEHARRVGEIGISGMAAIYVSAIKDALKAIGKL